MKILKLKEHKLDYYEEFLKNANIAFEISTTLKEFVKNFDINELPNIVKNVHKLENDADKNLHETLNFLTKDFLPPIEREDIVLLVNKIDDIIDYLDEIVINLDILDISILRDNFKNFVNLIDRLSSLLTAMLKEFKDIKHHEEVHNFVIDINKTEEAGDKIFEKAIKDLYKNEKNPIEIIKWNTIYNSFENCIDSYESVANTVDEIILKNT